MKRALTPVVFGCTTFLCSHTHGSIARLQRKAVLQALRFQAVAVVLQFLTAQVCRSGKITEEIANILGP